MGITKWINVFENIRNLETFFIEYYGLLLSPKASRSYSLYIMEG